MSRLIQCILISLLVTMLSSCMGLNLREGIESFRAQDYRRAFVRLMPEAQKGQPDAQYAIGYMYYYGRGVVEERRKAWYWINMAARSGQKDALLAVQLMAKEKKF